MDIQWNANLIDLQELIDLSRGDSDMTKRYLQQFLEMIPEQIQEVEGGLANQDRISVRQAMHQMNPQLQFFGVPNVEESISQIVREYQDMEWEDLEGMAEDILGNLQDACGEVERVLDRYF